MKAKLEEAEEADLQSRRNDKNSRLKSYTDRFRRPGESRDHDRNSQRSLTAEHRAVARDSSASWRKKDSRFVRPDSSELHDKEDHSDRVRKQEELTANVEEHRPARSCETASSQSRAKPARKSCNYRYTYFTYFCDQ